MRDGGINGFPVVDVRVRCVDGKYHSVDSSEMSFRMAGRIGFKSAMADAGPIILEPISPDLGHRAVRLPGRRDGRSVVAARAGAGNRGGTGRDAGHHRPGADLRDHALRHRPALAHPGLGDLRGGPRPLRRAAASTSENGCSPRCPRTDRQTAGTSRHTVMRRVPAAARVLRIPGVQIDRTTPHLLGGGAIQSLRPDVDPGLTVLHHRHRIRRQVVHPGGGAAAAPVRSQHRKVVTTGHSQQRHRPLQPAAGAPGGEHHRWQPSDRLCERHPARGRPERPSVQRRKDPSGEPAAQAGCRHSGQAPPPPRRPRRLVAQQLLQTHDRNLPARCSPGGAPVR